MNFSAKKTTISNTTLKKYQQIKPNYTTITSLTNDEDYQSSQIYNVQSQYNHNNNSDLDTIYINNLSTLANDIQNTFENENDYFIYCKYLEGKTLQDIIDEDYKHNLLRINNCIQIQTIMNNNNMTGNAVEITNRINQTLQKFNSSHNLKNFSKLSTAMMHAEIVEVCHTDSGYDAFVLKDVNGNYMIVNSCTNDKSLKDILAISYSICKYLTGSEDFVQIVFDYLVNNADLTNVSQEYFSISECFDGNNNLYHEQVQDNIKLIEKYCDKAKNDGVKVDLYGYSLGGGIQETSYAIFKNTNSSKQQYIQSISVYNPFTLYAQEYQDNLIDLLANDDKLCIYSAEQDYVSTFNDSVEALLKNTVFLKADDIESNSINGIGDVGGLIIGSDSNHGFAPLELSAFDENGNIIDPGKFISIDSSIRNATAGKSLNSENKYKPNYQDIFNDIFNIDGIQSSLDKIDSKKVKVLVKDLVDYFGNNFGQIKYEELTSILSNDIANIVSDEVYKLVRNTIPDLIFGPTIGRGAQILFDENDLANSIDRILNSNSGKDLVLDILSCYLNNDIPAYNRQIDRLVEAMIYIFGHSGNMFSQINNGLFTDKLQSKLKSTLKLKVKEIEVTESKDTLDNVTDNNSTINPPITTTTTTEPTTTTTTTTTTATPTTPAVTTGGIAPSNLPPQIAYDPLVVEILGYPRGGYYTTTTTTTTTTTAR